MAAIVRLLGERIEPRTGSYVARELGHGGTKIVYRGDVDLVDGGRATRLQLYGEGHYDNEHGELKAFRLVALGMRKGAHRFNQRSKDLGPAPIGFAISRYSVPEPEPRDVMHRAPGDGPSRPATGRPGKTVDGPEWPRPY